MYSRHRVIEEDGVVARCVNRVLRRRIRHLHPVLEQKTLLKDVAVLPASCLQSNMMYPCRVLVGIEFAAAPSGSNADGTVKERKPGRLIRWQIADVVRPEILVTEPAERLVVELY